MCTRVQGPVGPAASDSLELELQLTKDQLAWMLGTQLGSLERAASALNR